MVFLAKEDILCYVDAAMITMGYAKRGELFILWRENTVTTLYPLFRAEHSLQFTIGNFNIWDQINQISLLREGSYWFSSVLGGANPSRTYYDLPKETGLPLDRLRKYGTGDLYGEDISFKEYCQILDRGLFPFLRFISTWQGHKLTTRTVGSRRKVNICLYDRDSDTILAMREKLERQVDSSSGSSALLESIEILDHALALIEKNDQEGIEEYLFNKSKPMRELLRRYNIPNSGLKVEIDGDTGTENLFPARFWLHRCR